jgi:hypothetical protein
MANMRNYLYPLKNNKAFSTLLAVAIIVIVVVAVVISAGLYFWYSLGNQKTQTYLITDFTALNISSGFKVNITQSTTYSITITANERIINQVEVTKNENTLTIDVKPGVNFGVFNAEAQITMPKLDNIEFSGAIRGTAQGFINEDPFDLTLTGASSFEMINFQGGNMNVELSGASRLTIAGSANDLTSVVSGASSLNLQDLIVKNANMIIGGASHASINLNGKLDADVSGASSLEYSGEPTLGNINTSEASTINKK